MDRLLLTLLVAAFFALCAFGMWRGWRRQARSQSVEFPPFPEPPADRGEASAELPGLYVASTRAGHWQERIVTRGLGLRTTATLRVYPAGVDVERVGAPGFWIPRESIVDVKRGRGMAGKVMGTDALLVITWRVGDREVDTGFRADDVSRYSAWIEELSPDTPVATNGDELSGEGRK